VSESTTCSKGERGETPWGGAAVKSAEVSCHLDAAAVVPAFCSPVRAQGIPCQHLHPATLWSHVLGLCRILYASVGSSL
jgi:hypothetical protein